MPCDPEFEAALRKLGLEWSGQEVDELFRAVDTDKSRSIDYAEFRRALRTPCAVEKWANTIPWPKLFTHFIHPSKSERHKHNPLGGLLDSGLL